MKIIRWLFLNGCFAGLVYLGMYENHAVARYFVYGTVAVFVLLSLILTLGHSHLIKTVRMQDLPVPPFVDKAYDFAITAALVYAGFVITGVAYLLTTFILHGVVSDAIAYRKKKLDSGSDEISA